MESYAARRWAKLSWSPDLLRDLVIAVVSVVIGGITVSGSTDGPEGWLFWIAVATVPVLVYEIGYRFYRVLWAIPAELDAEAHQTIQAHERALAEAKHPFSVKLKHGNISLVHDDKDLDPHFYAVLKEVVITNASEKRLSCEAWLRFGLSQSYAIAVVARTESLPEWVLQDLDLSPNKQMGRVLNLGGIESSPVGYLAFKFRKRQLSLLTWHDDAAQQAILALPRWLEVKNLANEQGKLLPLNSEATLADTRRSAARTAAPSPSQGA